MCAGEKGIDDATVHVPVEYTDCEFVANKADIHLEGESAVAIAHLMMQSICNGELKERLVGDLRTTPDARRVICNDPATVVLWEDGTKTVAKCHDGDRYDPVVGIAICVLRKLTRNRGRGVDANESELMRLGDEDAATLASRHHLLADVFDVVDSIQKEM